MKSFWKGFATCYIAVAIVCGFAMKAVLPELNPLGIAYSGLTWPISTGCVALKVGCSAVPPQRYAKWLFTFEGQQP